MTATKAKTEYVTTMRLEASLWERLQAVKRDYGIPLSEQMRRGLELWLHQLEKVPAVPRPALVKGRR